LRTIFGIRPSFDLHSFDCILQKTGKVCRPKEKVTIGSCRQFLSSPIIIAQEKDYFSEEGLDVAFKYYPSGKKAMEAMFAGEVDIATVAETPLY